MQINYDFTPVLKISNALRAAGKQVPLILNRAINHAGDKARNQMRTVLVGQTGLKRKTLVKAVKSRKAFGGGAYTIYSKGGNVRLKFFGARETRAGVSAAPWNKRQVYAGTFIKGGRFPKRVALGMGGHVFKRTGAGRLPIENSKSGLFIATEMITGKSESIFYTTVERDLPDRIAHELAFVLGGK